MTRVTTYKTTAMDPNGDWETSLGVNTVGTDDVEVETVL